MENKRCRYDKLWCAKEEVKDLERLLEEARMRLNNEYENNGGRLVGIYVVLARILLLKVFKI